MGIRITTDEYGVKVYRQDKNGFPQYYIRISKKLENGEYVADWQEVRFRKGVELANKEEINISDGFETLNTWTDKKTGETRFSRIYQITEFSYRTPRRQTQEPQRQTQNTQMRVEAELQGFDDMPDSFSAAEDEIPF